MEVGCRGLIARSAVSLGELVGWGGVGKTVKEMLIKLLGPAICIYTVLFAGASKVLLLDYIWDVHDMSLWYCYPLCCCVPGQQVVVD